MFLLNFLALLAISASPAAASDQGPAAIASLVDASDDAVPVASLGPAIASPEALVRATAARVALVRGAEAILPALREQLTRETDAAAAREEVRAIAFLGNAADIDFAIAAAHKWPASIDNDLALAVARRGGTEALAFYSSKRGQLRSIDPSRFLRLALWGRTGLLSVAASRILGAADVAGWKALLQESRDSRLPVEGSILVAAMQGTSEEMRSATAWHVARLYARDPGQMPQALRDLPPSSAEASDREAFARELIARMSGGTKKSQPRLMTWLDSPEADEILGGETDEALFSWFTDEEYAARRSRCGVLPFECAMPQVRRKLPPATPPQPVAPPEFNLPGVLPAGLASKLLTCSDGWLGVSAASVSARGVVDAIDFGSVDAGHCSKALRTMLRLSLPFPAAMSSAHSSKNVVLVRMPRQPLCLDEAPPSESLVAGPLRAGGKVVAPKVEHRVEPWFPDSARRTMGPQKGVMVILECLITRDGCVRDIRLVGQSAYPEINSAAIRAVSQWTFRPGTLNGQPVDVLFNLTVSFRTN